MRDHRRLLLPLLFLFLSMPAEAGVWTPIGPDGGGTIRRLLIDPATPTTLYAATELDFYKSTDGGVTWAASNAGLPPARFAYRAAIVPTAPNVLYAFMLGFPDEGLYKSTDGAASWSVLPAAPAGTRSLAVDAVNPALVYVGTSSGQVHRSTDGGATWAATFVPGQHSSVEALAADPVTGGVLYAATYETGNAGDRVYKSTDGGVTFVVTPLANEDVLSLAVDPVNPSIVYAGAGGLAFPAVPPIWKSTDGGATWNSASSGLSTLFGELPIVVDPTSHDTIYVGGFHGPYKSVDGGATWAVAQNGIDATQAYAFAIHPAGGTLWAGTDGGVFKTVDGATTWAASGTGMREDALTGIAVDPADAAVLYTGSASRGIQKSVDAGAHWSAANVGLPAPSLSALALHDGSTLHALAENGTIVARTGDGAATWAETIDGLPIGSEVSALAVDPSDPAVVYVGIDAEDFIAPTSGVYKSNDGGLTWTPTGGPTSITIKSLAVASSGRVYAGTDFPRQVFASGDGGASWSPGVFVPTGVLALAVDPVDPLTVYAGTTSAGVYYSNDGGATWFQGDFIGGPQVNALLVDPFLPGRVYAATVNGVQASLDGGATWSDLSGGLRVRDTTALAADPVVPGRVYVATLGAAAYRRDVGTCAVDADCDDINLCTTDACLPTDPASDAFGCIHTQPPCPPAGDCKMGAGTCNASTGICSYANRPEGSACASDGTVCTTDACSAGVCTHTATLDLGCRLPSVPGASTFTFKNNALPQRASLTWKWKKGDATLGEIGDPFSANGTNYELCVYDRSGSGGLPRYLFGIRAPAAGTCGTKPCWSSNATTVRYRDKDRTPDGLSTLIFKPGSPGQASMSASAKGVNLHLPTAALSPTVTVQLRSDQPLAACWQGIYNAGVKKNVPGQFKGKSQ